MKVYKPYLIRLEDVVKNIENDEELRESLLLYFHLNICTKGEITWLTIPETQEELNSYEYEIGMLFLSVLAWTDLHYGDMFLLEG